LGLTIYQAIGRLHELESAPRLVNFASSGLSQLSADLWQKRLRSLEELAQQAGDHESLAEHAFRHVRFSNWSPLRADALQRQLTDLRNILATTRERFG